MDTTDSAAIDTDLSPGHMIRRRHQIPVGIFLQEIGGVGVAPVQDAARQARAGTVPAMLRAQGGPVVTCM